MKKRINLKDHVVTAAGTSNNRRWQARVKAQGGKATRRIGQTTTLLIHGDTHRSNQVRIAQGRGLVMLTEAQGEDLLLNGFVEVEAPDQASDGVQELIGELRAVFDKPPSSQSWNTIVDCVDQCIPEHLDSLVGYIQSQLEGWDDTQPPWVKWSPSQEPKPSDVWSQALPSGELRVMPQHWQGQLIQGVESPAYQLARVMELETLRLKATTLKRVLSSPNLTHLRMLHLGRGNTYAPSFWKALPTFSSLASLEVLSVSVLNAGHVEALIEAATDWHPPLHTLMIDCRHVSARQFRFLVGMLRLPAFKGLGTLKLREMFPADLQFWNAIAKEIASLNTLHIVTHRTGLETMTYPTYGYQHTPSCIRLEGTYYGVESEFEFASLMKQHVGLRLDVLDLSLYKMHDERVQEIFQRRMLEYLPNSRYIKNVRQVMLGPWQTEALVCALEEAGTEVLSW